MICKNCGHELNASDIFCIRCGSAVTNNLFSTPVINNLTTKEFIKTVEKTEPENLKEAPSIPDLSTEIEQREASLEVKEEIYEDIKIVKETIENIEEDLNDSMNSSGVAFVDNIVKETENNEEFNKPIENYQIESEFKQPYNDISPDWAEVVEDDYIEDPEDVRNIERYFQERNEDLSKNDFSYDVAQKQTVENTTDEEIIDQPVEVRAEENIEESTSESVEEIDEKTIVTDKEIKNNISLNSSDEYIEESENINDEYTLNEPADNIEETVKEGAVLKDMLSEEAKEQIEQQKEYKEHIIQKVNEENTPGETIENTVNKDSKVSNKVDMVLNVAIGILSCITVYLGLQYFGVF